MPKSNRKRTTTSVSTLVGQINDLRTIAKVAGRKDLLKEFNLIAIEVNFLVEKYVSVRRKIDPYVKIMLAKDSLGDPAAENEALELEELEEAEHSEE